MKKWGKRLLVFLLLTAILIVGADLLLRFVSSRESVRVYVADKIISATGREAKLDKLSVSLMGISFDGFTLSEEGGFEQGTFVSVPHFRLGLKLSHLLHLHLKLRVLTVKDAEIFISRNKNGVLNFESLMKGQEETVENEPSEEEKKPFNITLNRLNIQNAHIYFTDEEQQIEASLKGVEFAINRLGFFQPFRASLTGIVDYKDPRYQLSLPLKLNLNGDLKELKLKEAFVELETFSTQYKDTLLTVSGHIKDFKNPKVKAKLQLKDISSHSLGDFIPALPEFLISDISLHTEAETHLAEKELFLKKLVFEMEGLKTEVSGNISYKEKLSYALHFTLEALLKKLADNVPQLAALYQPKGTVSVVGKVADSSGLEIQANLSEGSAVIEHIGHLTDAEMEISAKEHLNFMLGNAAGKLSGKLNTEPFSADFSLLQEAERWVARFDVTARRIALQTALLDKQGQNTKKASSPAEKNAWPFPPLDITSTISVDSLDVPYFSGNQVRFKADLKGITPNLKQAQGVFSLQTNEGEIRDIYVLTNANPIMKVLFLSLGVVSKVFNSLNVFALLEGIGSGVLSAVSSQGDAPEEMVVQTVIGEDGQPMQVMIPQSQRKTDGKMSYDKFATEVVFKDGVAQVEKGSFVSEMMSFNLSGTTDFNTEKLDMKVQAAPGKHETDGIMPLRVTIGGSISEPQGNISMVGSLSSLVSQGITNNFATRSVKKGLSGFFGLFKKKPKTEQTEESSTETENKPEE